MTQNKTHQQKLVLVHKELLARLRPHNDMLAFVLNSVSNENFNPENFRKQYFYIRPLPHQPIDYLLFITDDLTKKPEEINNRIALAMVIFKMQMQFNKNKIGVREDELIKINAKTAEKFFQFITKARKVLKTLSNQFNDDLDYFEALVLDGKRNENRKNYNSVGYYTNCDNPENFEELAKKLNKQALDNGKFVVKVDPDVTRGKIQAANIRSYRETVVSQPSISEAKWASYETTCDNTYDDTSNNKKGKKIINPNSNYINAHGPKNKQAEENIKKIQELIKIRIEKLESSKLYSAAALAKADAFKDLLKLIDSRRDNFHVESLIQQWKQRDSGHWNKITFNEKNQKIKTAVTVESLMQQECGIFTFFGLSNTTASMNLINVIEELARKTNDLKPKETAVKASPGKTARL